MANIKKNRKVIPGLLAVCLTAGLFSGCQLLPQEEEELAPPAQEAAEVVYNTYEVEKGTISDVVTGVGEFVSTETENIFFEGNGRLGSINVKYGQKVAKGDVLVEMDVGDLEHTKTLQYYSLKQAQLRLEALKASAASSYDIQSAEYDVKIANLNYQATVATLKESILYAPIDGVVSYMAELKPGDYVEAYTNLVQVVNPSSLVIALEDTSASDFKMGQTVTATYGAIEYTGTVVQSVDDKSTSDADGTKTVTQTLIQLDNFVPEDNIIGKQVTVEFVRQEKTDVIVVPKRVISQSMGLNVVYLLVDGEKVEVNVELGISSNNDVEVVSGLNVGDKIIIS